MPQRQPSIFVLSGGRGFAGNLVVQSVLAQFPDSRVPVQIIPRLSKPEDARAAVEAAAAAGGIVVHTMVDQRVREAVQAACREKGVRELDLVGGLESYLTEMLNTPPLNEPGLYRRLNQPYYDRIDALEFTIACDDGLNLARMKQADVILAGVSRTGKTPLSMYLTMFGWKVGNIPIVKDIPPPEQLFSFDPRRVFGLDIAADELIEQRRKRMRGYSRETGAAYLDPQRAEDELEYARRIFRKGGFSRIDVSHKPIEVTANEIVSMLTDRFDLSARVQP